MLSQRAAVALAWLHIGGPRSRPPAAWATADQLSGSGRRVLGFPVSGACSGRGLPPPAPWFPGPPCCGLWAPLPPRGRRAARRVDSAPSIHPVSSPVDAHSVVSTCRLLGAAFSFPSRSRGCLSPWGQVGGGGGGDLGGERRGHAGLDLRRAATTTPPFPAKCGRDSERRQRAGGQGGQPEGGLHAALVGSQDLWGLQRRWGGQPGASGGSGSPGTATAQLSAHSRGGGGGGLHGWRCEGPSAEAGPARPGSLTRDPRAAPPPLSASRR